MTKSQRMFFHKGFAGAFTKLRDGSTYDTLLHGKALLVITAGDADDLFPTNSSASLSTGVQGEIWEIHLT